MLREKAEDLKETMESVSKLSSDRLNALEQALPLAEHFFDTHNVLNQWMDALEDEMAVLDSPASKCYFLSLGEILPSCFSMPLTTISKF